ncbi:hypothetical protein PVK06_003226 [Gossypium arboreum]|uniref:Uncharacterized protein n=1 Tax=Gossypium arboreum TaxID=29729 RepID=A0ABR0R5R5_GOSAR|nr:hypothetical protein PVK06_003226 [Gossypium arboreum]
MEGDKNHDILAVTNNNLPVKDVEMNVGGVGVFITRVGDKNLRDLDSSAGPNSKPISGVGSSKGNATTELVLMGSGHLGVGPMVESVKQGFLGQENIRE